LGLVQWRASLDAIFSARDRWASLIASDVMSDVVVQQRSAYQPKSMTTAIIPAAMATAINAGEGPGGINTVVCVCVAKLIIHFLWSLANRDPHSHWSPVLLKSTMSL
jgi:hypothetical protein